MEWNVYYYDINSREIKLFNVLRNNENIKKTMKKHKDRNDFSEALIREMQYRFWSRAEWELIIEITKDNRIFLSPWCGCSEPEKVKVDVTDDTNFDWRGFAELHIDKQIYKNKAKIDVYDQLCHVWDEFVDCVWNNQIRRSKKKKSVEVVGDADQSGLASAT